MCFTIQPIGLIRTPYKQKFAIPRQPGLVASAKGKIEFAKDFCDPNFLRGIEQFSHLWLLFQFHQTTAQGWSPLVRPPRLGGNTKIGVFATRSTFRPNNMGMSVVKFIAVEQDKSRLSLIVSGIDLLDGTPIIDIKPYLPYADHVPQATSDFAHSQPIQMPVTFSKTANQHLIAFKDQYPELKQLIAEVLAQDPRPAYQAKNANSKSYGMGLYDLNIRWTVVNEICIVEEITSA